MPVRRMDIDLAPQGHHIPPYVLSALHYEHGQVAEHVAIDAGLEIGGSKAVGCAIKIPINIARNEPNEYRDGVGAHWTFLSDPGRKVQKDLDIAEYTDPEHNPMIPRVIVLEPGLVIFKIYNGYWFFGRPTIEELRQDLRAVLKKCRPDWDISRPELKAAWERGEHDRSYPYGKTYGQVFRGQE